jgi:sortase A
MLEQGPGVAEPSGLGKHTRPDEQIPVPAPPAKAAPNSSLATPGAPQVPANRGIAIGVLTTIALLSAWFLLYTMLLTPFSEARAQAIKYGELRGTLALQTTPYGGDIAPDSPVAILSAPELGMKDTVVVEGTASSDLMLGPGHLRNTPLPGQIGNSVLMGRPVMFGGPFGKLNQAKVGDTISVTSGQGVFTYIVESVRRAGSPLPQPLASGKGRLTLITSEGSGFLGSWHPDQLLYVDAALKGDAQQYPPGRPLVVPSAEWPLHSDPSALLPLALTLPLLIGAIVFVVWARSRWGNWQAWVFGVPLVLAALYAVSQSAVQLLPNLV